MATFKPKQQPQVIGIVGTRRKDHYTDQIRLEKALDKIIKSGDKLVSGGCPKGADRFAENIAKARGLTITIHYPDWDQHKQAAGIIRNTDIAKSCDILLAMVADDRTGGTEDTIRKAEKLGKKVIVVK